MSGEDNGPLNMDLPADARDDDDKDAWRSRWLRLFFIPLLVYIAWLIETHLLGSRTGLFTDPSVAGIILYTVISCIILGVVIPALLIQKAFRSGAVNMHHVGFRPLWRTGPIVLITIIILAVVSLFLKPLGPDPLVFIQGFMLVLPTAVASVMICFVLMGTHLQAFMRDGGILTSISSGVIVTSVFFAFSALVRSPPQLGQDLLLFGLASGVLISVFFFAIRDIYATCLVAAVSLTFSPEGWVSRPPAVFTLPAIEVSAILAALSLVAVHVYFSWRYTTVMVKVR